MNPQDGVGGSAPRSDDGKPAADSTPTGHVQPGQGEGSTVVKPTTSKELTEEEQMALYEKDLKENDWGHQPC